MEKSFLRSSSNIFKLFDYETMKRDENKILQALEAPKLFSTIIEELNLKNEILSREEF